MVGKNMKRWRYVILFVFLAIIAYVVYVQIRIPPGVAPICNSCIL